MIFTRLPLNRLIDVENVFELAGILSFDLWTSNNGRSGGVVFSEGGWAHDAGTND